MSEKNGSQAFAPKSIDTLVGAGMRIDGDIACTGVLRVQGEIVGNVSSTDKGDASLMVDSAGSVTGAVNAAHISVRGRIAGPVQSRQTIEVHQGGSIVGDLSFNRIAIHAGGVVDGMFTPVVVKEVPKTEADRTTPVANAGEGSRRSGGTRKVSLAVAAIAVLAVGVWMARHPEMLSRLKGDDAALKADAALNSPLASQPAPTVAAASPLPREPEPTAVPAVPAAPAATPPSASVAAQEAVPPSEAAEKEDPQDKIVSVKGINPSRPAGVFLLVSNESSVLYRKKRDEPGEGVKVTVPAGEKVSIAIARGELIRVAQGRDVVILFQGAKVPANIIQSGSWISFIPR